MLSGILSHIETLTAFDDLLEDIKVGACSESCLKLPRATRLPVIAAIKQKLNVPVILVTDRTDHALTLLEELSLWLPDTPRFYFPEPNPLFYEDAAWGVTTRRDRLLALTFLASRQIPGAPRSESAPIIVAPARAIMTRTLPRRDFIRNSSTIKLDQVIQPDALVQRWVSLGYEPANIVVSSGQFARRGGILDIWPPAEIAPHRIEFFGDEIDTIRTFDPASQRTTGPVNRLLVTPAREFITPEPGNSHQAGSISEFSIPLIHSTPASVLDYLPSNGIIAIDDGDMFASTVEDIEEQSLSLRKDYIEEGLLTPDFPIPYITWGEIQDTLPMGHTLNLGPLSTLDEDLAFGDESRIPERLADHFQPNPRFGGQLKSFIDHLIDASRKEEKVIIISRQSTRLKELWKERRGQTNRPDPEIIQGSLSEGWLLTPPGNTSIHLFTDGEIFGWRRPQPRKRHRPVAQSPEAAYADLNINDWVVHVDHGVGKYTGLVQRVIDNVDREYLCLEYADGDQLFVPVHQSDRITRYVGPDSREPKPTRLGGTEWKNVKSRVRQAIKEMADDLLDLYAQRSVVQGYAFNADSAWQQELEASFPYIETEDQLRVINEVKTDMESPQPMDRLVCGDVGYGKTEVALRASFKAVMDGKQVALLVPTTVLAQQHYHTFRERLAAFPVEVEMLSRFRTPQQQRKIINQAAKGKIDILIGTHRLLSGDVNFKDLGLLIIDEEQRFGVTHKEAIKQMRTEIDVLTMTATPIPRTLYMTLTGVRDISTITTPPEERLPVITHVGPYDPRIVRKAVLREIERGGQVFFVHNRVQTILSMREHLKKLVPEARVGVGHGQMPEAALSSRMREFSAGDVDILLSTSIIESGLDIPNANTLIVDRADTFGLAQLYQLRGRVGRGAQRAYAYFFKHKKRAPTIDGHERLETIAENTQLGAGFAIAMRDLEIRGAGDILGGRQHGHIAAVGFHLYTRLLANEVERLRSGKEAHARPVRASEITLLPLVTVDLPFNTNIPSDYVPDREMRLGLYRRIADITDLEKLNSIKAEFNDRFGPLPESVDNLLYQFKVKHLADQAGLSSIAREKDKIILRYPEGVTPPLTLVDSPGVRTAKFSIWITPALLPSDDWQQHLVDLLHFLVKA